LCQNHEPQQHLKQVPYLPWAKIKGTRYHWDGKQGPDVKGTIFGVAVELTSSIGVEFGTEKSFAHGKYGT
jgi:hypothetical protein